MTVEFKSSQVYHNTIIQYDGNWLITWDSDDPATKVEMVRAETETKINLPWVKSQIEQVRQHITRADGSPKDGKLTEALKQVEAVISLRKEPRD